MNVENSETNANFEIIISEKPISFTPCDGQVLMYSNQQQKLDV